MEQLNIKAGDKLYDILPRYIITWYTYVCPHPNNPKYHILLNDDQQPIRMYHIELETLIYQGFSDYDTTLEVLATRLEEYAAEIRLNLIKSKNLKGENA